MINEVMQYLIDNHIPPAIIMMLGGMLIPLTKHYFRLAIVFIVPIITLVYIWQLVPGIDITNIVQFKIGNFTLLPLYAHPYTLIFSTTFCIAVFAAGIFGVAQSRGPELVAGFVCAGGAIGVCFSGDFITMFMYWEIMAIASCVIIFSSYEEFAGKAGVRYAIMHFFSGVLLLAGIIAQIYLSGNSQLVNLYADMAILFPGFALDMNGTISWLIMLGLLINLAVPPFSAWLPDSYPKASPAGAVFLSAINTKTAIFALILIFPGTKLFVFIGLFMIVYGVVYAILENDIRRVLSYSVISQIGFMLIGVSIGTDMALNGVAVLAFSHVMYKSLLFMSAGSVMYMTGKSGISDLGGLSKTMKITTVCAIIGTVSMVAFPLTSAFVSKPIIIAAAADEGLAQTWFMLLLLSGLMVLPALKFLWFVFFGTDAEIKQSDPPLNMLLAMIILAVLCVVPAIPPFTQNLYAMLPSPIEYDAYTFEHIITDLQILLFSAIAFFLMLPLLKSTKTISLDFDWLYRGLARYVILALFKISEVPTQFTRIMLKKLIRKMEYFIHKTHGPGSIMARSWTISTTVMWTILLLGVYLVVYYFAGGGKII